MGASINSIDSVKLKKSVSKYKTLRELRYKNPKLYQTVSFHKDYKFITKKLKRALPNTSKKPIFGNVEKNKQTVMNFIIKNKRKPSRYSRNKEENRIWSLFGGYTSKSNRMYDRDMANQLKTFFRKNKIETRTVWTDKKIIQKLSKLSEFPTPSKNSNFYHVVQHRGLSKYKDIFASMNETK